jgi:hypothetical protein
MEVTSTSGVLSAIRESLFSILDANLFDRVFLRFLEEEEVVEVEEEVSEIDSLKNEIKSLREMLETKKAPVEAQTSKFDVEGEVKKLIKAGRATPSMKNALLEVANVSEEAFRSMAASLPKMVSLGTKAKLAKVEEQTKPAKKKKITMEDPEWYDSDEYKEMLKAIGM